MYIAVTLTSAVLADTLRKRVGLLYCLVTHYTTDYVYIDLSLSNDSPNAVFKVWCVMNWSFDKYCKCTLLMMHLLKSFDSSQGTLPLLGSSEWPVTHQDLSAPMGLIIGCFMPGTLVISDSVCLYRKLLSIGFIPDGKSSQKRLTCIWQEPILWTSPSCHGGRLKEPHVRGTWTKINIKCL